MGIFGFLKGNKQKSDKGEMYYRMSLNHNEHEREYLEKSAELGNRHGKAGLARYYLEHFPKDTEKMRRAAQLMEEAEAQGAMIDREKLAKIYENLGDNNSALESRLKLAEAGDAKAQLAVAYAYESGEDGISIDYEKARFWYEKAMEQNGAAAHNNMALLYLNGRGVKKDEKKALELMQKAAELGSAAACSNLAWKYYNGEPPCPRDDTKALEYAKLGTEKGNARCRYVLALINGEGRGVPQDLSAAIDILETLVKEKYEDAEKAYDKYSAMFKEWQKAGFEARYKEIYPMIENEPKRALELFKKLASDGYRGAIDGVRAAERRLAEIADDMFEKAKAANDEKGMREAADNDSPKGCLHYLNEARKMAREAAYERKITLTDDELCKLSRYYWVCAANGVKPSPEDMDMLLIVISVRGEQLIDSGDRKTAIKLLDRFGDFNDPFCQYLLAKAYDDGSWAGEDKALAVLEKMMQNPKINDGMYDGIRRSAQENIDIIYYNKSIRDMR